MKPLRRTVLVLFSLLVVAGAIAYLGLDRILKTTVEKQSSASLKLSTTLNSARLSLFGGKLNLNRLRIASPQGFSAPHMLELGDTDLAVSYGQLRKDPIHVQSLTLNQPRLVIEQSNGALNFKKAMDRMPASDNSAEKPVKLVIDELNIQQAQVVIHPGLPGVREEIVVPVRSISMKNIGNAGGAQNGAAIKDVVMQVISALAGAAAESDSLPPELKAILHLNAKAVLVEGVHELAKDPAKALENAGAIFAPAGRSAEPKKR